MRKRFAAFTLDKLPAVRGRKRPAFTLVELLVVVGIIALLIAILLPVLNRAREQARLVNCLSNLRQIYTGAMAFSAEHYGHFPLAGFTGVSTPMRVGRNLPSTNYDYFVDEAWSNTQRIVPLPAEISRYLGMPVRMDSRASIQADLADVNLGMRRVFTCPSDDTYMPPAYPYLKDPASGLYDRHIGLFNSQVDRDGSTSGYYFGPTCYSSYIYNAAALGLHPFPPGPVTSADAAYWCPRYEGILAKMRNLTNLMFMADGLNRNDASSFQDSGFEVDNDTNSPSTRCTLANAYCYYQGVDGNMFDTLRHRGRKMNIVFMDGHADTITLPITPPWLGTSGGAGLPKTYIGADGFAELDRVIIMN